MDFPFHKRVLLLLAALAAVLTVVRLTAQEEIPVAKFVSVDGSLSVCVYDPVDCDGGRVLTFIVPEMPMTKRMLFTVLDCQSDFNADRYHLVEAENGSWLAIIAVGSGVKVGKQIELTVFVQRDAEAVFDQDSPFPPNAEATVQSRISETAEIVIRERMHDGTRWISLSEFRVKKDQSVAVKRFSANAPYELVLNTSTALSPELFDELHRTFMTAERSSLDIYVDDTKQTLPPSVESLVNLLDSEVRCEQQ